MRLDGVRDTWGTPLADVIIPFSSRDKKLGRSYGCLLICNDNFGCFQRVEIGGGGMGIGAHHMTDNQVSFL